MVTSLWVYLNKRVILAISTRRDNSNQLFTEKKYRELWTNHGKYSTTVFSGLKSKFNLPNTIISEILSEQLGKQSLKLFDVSKENDFVCKLFKIV